MLITQFDLNPGIARALYSYQAQSAEELSFQEGALIKLTRCQHGEVCVMLTQCCSSHSKTNLSRLFRNLWVTSRRLDPHLYAVCELHLHFFIHLSFTFYTLIHSFNLCCL